MAVFDIDMTLLDNEQRYKDAKRAGIIDKDSKPKRKTRFETPGKAFKRAQEFLFDSSRLDKDRLIPGAADFVNSLVEQGYIIAYCTSRRLTFYEVTKRQLEKKGFPMMMDDMGRELLFMKSGGSDTSAKYKQKVVTELNSSYDVRFFFDDMIENLQAVAQVGVPGLYPSIKAYTDLSAKSNPYIAAGTFGQGYDYSPHLDSAKLFHEQGNAQQYAERMESTQWDPEVEEEFGYRYDGAEVLERDFEDKALSNPPVKPRRKKMSNGKYRKEPAKKYIDRFMGNSKMVSEFPDRGQRYAVSLRYVEKFYGKSGLDSVGARQNPGHDADEPYTISMRTFDKWGFEHTDRFGKSATAKTLEQAIEIAEEMDDDYLSYPMDLPKAQGGDGSNLITITDSSGDVVWENPRNNPEEYSENYMVPRDIHRLGKAADRLEDTYEDGQEVPEWWKSKLSVTAKDTDTLADSLDYVAENPMPLMGLSVQVSGYRNAAGAFVMKGKKFLILQRSKKETSMHGLWELPGGKVEEGETPRQAAVIEAKEEAGLDIKLKANLGPHHDDKKKKTYHAYIATPKKGQKVKLSEEHSDYKWVTPEEVLAMPKKMVSHHLLYFLKKEGEAIRSNPSSWDQDEFERELAFDEFKTDLERNIKAELEELGINTARPYSHLGDYYIGEIDDHPTSWGAYKRVDVYLDESMDEDVGEYTVEYDENMPGRTEIEFLAADSYVQKMLDEQNRSNPRSNPRKNPNQDKKIEKGKKLYKHMNGKEPEKITKQKVDMGDVWYQVGEGGCWQIGYMSGKETGSSNQKYTHTFNEETQDGNFPKLYATMPESGKPLLIIQGGTWKIKTDDKGVAWIYD